MPPRMLGAVNHTSHARVPASSPRYAIKLANAPGHSATALVAFADNGGTPSHTTAGNVTSVPPPATELIAPPMAAARKTRKYVKNDTARQFSRPEALGGTPMFQSAPCMRFRFAMRLARRKSAARLGKRQKASVEARPSMSRSH